MRNFIISLICTLAVLAAWGGFHSYSAEMTDDLQAKSNELIFSSIEKEDWISAEEDYMELSQLWHRYRRPASVFLDARDINEIDSIMDKAYLYMKAEDVSNSSGEFCYLKDKFKALSESDTVSLANIF